MDVPAVATRCGIIGFEKRERSDVLGRDDHFSASVKRTDCALERGPCGWRRQYHGDNEHGAECRLSHFYCLLQSSSALRVK